MIVTPPLDRAGRPSAKLPLYAQLKEEIIAAIARGELAAGDQIPSQRVLCERHGMSHMTVRRAISELLSEGVLYAIPGKGLYVTEPKQDAEPLLIGFSEDMARRGMAASSQVLAAEIVGASTVLASALGVTVGTPLVHLRRLRLADGEPMAIQSSYLPHALCPGLLAHDLGGGSLFALLRSEYHLHLADGTTVVEAALADAEQARLLGLRLPAPVLIIEQLTYLDSGRAIEFVRSAYRADRYRLRL
ncbi:MAG TPA: GntR family transcriptional regulator [Roseiflexaceae bacterium]|nr:GntR family transcriptional regulator [Roseiflexaceae bacterium]